MFDSYMDPLGCTGPEENAGLFHLKSHAMEQPRFYKHIGFKAMARDKKPVSMCLANRAYAAWDVGLSARTPWAVHSQTAYILRLCT